MNASKKLDELYSGLPELECCGKCHSVCGDFTRAPICSRRESQRIEKATGVKLAVSQLNHKPRDFDASGTCPLLVDGKCSAYAIRPMVCRLWGCSSGPMACGYGCEPSKRLTPLEAIDFIHCCSTSADRRPRPA